MRRQRGQSSTEYIVVTAAIALALFQDISASKYGLLCPGGASQCNVMEMLMLTLKNRYEGYSYAISASEYPEPLINIPAPSNTGGGTSGTSGGSSSGGSSNYTPPSTMTAVSLDGKTTLGNIINGVVYDKDGKIVGTINEQGQVVDDSGTVIGTVSAGTGGTGDKIAVDKNGDPIGRIDKYGIVVDNDAGKIVGKQDEDLDTTHPENVYAADDKGAILVTSPAGKIVDKESGGKKVKVVVYDNGDPDGVIASVNGEHLLDKDGNALGNVTIIGQAGSIKGEDIVDKDGNVIGTFN